MRFAVPSLKACPGSFAMDEFEKKYWLQGREVIGIDEAGRGPICGPLVVCGVSFAAGYFHSEINDSKKLSAAKRKELFKIIIKQAKSYQIKIVPTDIIDKLNIYQATKQAMQEIAAAFSGVVLTDCMPLENCEHESLVAGDTRSISIAAASILAKVIRDHIMCGYHVLYPEYGYDSHKGYATRSHIAAVKRLGINHLYRLSFEPIKSWSKADLFSI